MKLHDFIKEQVNEINRHKWIESEQAGYDLGDHAVYDWVDKHAARFRAHILEDLNEDIEFPNGRTAPPMDAGGTICCSFACKRMG